MTHNVLEEYSTNHKQGASKLLKLMNKYLVMVTFENSENYSIRIVAQCLTWTEKHYSHSTSDLFVHVTV